MKRLYLIICFFCSALMFAQEHNLEQIFKDAKKLKYTQPKKADSLYRIIENTPKTPDTLLRKVYQNLGNLNSELGKSDLALKYYNKAYNAAIKTKGSISAGRILFNIATEHQLLGDYKTASKTHFDALYIMETIKDTIGIVAVYQHLGNLFTDINQIEKANGFYNKGATIAKQQKDTVAFLGNSFNLIYNFQEEKQYDKAFKIITNLKSYINNKTSNFDLLSYYASLAHHYISSNEKDYKKGLFYAQKSYETAKLSNSVYDEVNATNTLADVLLIMKKYKDCEIKLKEAETLLNKNPILLLKSTNTEIFSDLYETTSNYKKALHYLKLNKTVNDSLNKKEDNKALFNLNLKYETEQKDKTLAEQKLIIKEQELALFKRKNQIFWGIGIGFLFLLISLGLWLFLYQKQTLKTKEIKLLKHKNEQLKLKALIKGEEKERSRLAQDLHDGINGDLSAVKLELSSINTEGLLLNSQKNLSKAIQMIDASCQQIRTISHNLSPHAIQNFGLNIALQQFCSKLSNQNLKINYQWFGKETSLEVTVQTIIYRIVQELVFNIVKHSKANEGLVNVNLQEHIMYITVEDNGVGFNTKQPPTGIGLKNIASRIKYLDAEMDIDTSNNGSSFLISIPLEKNKNND